MGVKVMAIAERQIEWIPNGWDWGSRKQCIVRDGKIAREIPSRLLFPE